MKLTNPGVLSLIICLFCISLPIPAFSDTETRLKAIDRSIRLREYSKAVKQLQPLLKQNKAEAQYRMGGLYRLGKGVAKDMDKAIAEYRKASINGLDVAQFALASLLEKRSSSKQKMIEIQKWYKAAADQGHRKAIKKLAILENRFIAGNTPEISHENIFSAIRNDALEQIKSLKEQGVNLDLTDNRQRSTLMVALLSRHHKMSQLLLPISSQLDKPDINHDRPLHVATSNGYTDIVLSLIQKQVNINAIDKLGNTALIIATRHDNKKIIQHLLSNNADHSIKNKKGQTAPKLAQTLNLKQAKLVFKQHKIQLPRKDKNYARIDINSFKSTINKSASLYKGWPLINIASLLGESAIVGQLLDQGVDITATDQTGNSALHRAAGKGQLTTVKLLVSRGSNINAINHNGESALYMAASSGQLKVINYLLNKGADPSLIAKNKSSPLSIAISNQHLQSASALSRHKLDPASIHRALLLAIQNKMEGLSIQLIKRDTRLAIAYSKNRSALWHSANLGLIKTTKELLSHSKVNINLSDKNGYTPLARAVNNGFAEISSMLINHKARTNTLTNENNSILMLAVLSGKGNIIKQILKLKNNLNEKNKAGDTALMLAAATGDNTTVKLLIKAGADIQTRNKDDLNAYQIAINSGHDKTASIIRESSGKLFKLFN